MVEGEVVEAVAEEAGEVQVHLVHLQALGGAGLLAVGYSLVTAYVVAMLSRWG